MKVIVVIYSAVLEVEVFIFGLSACLKRNFNMYSIIYCKYIYITKINVHILSVIRRNIALLLVGLLLLFSFVQVAIELYGVSSLLDSHELPSLSYDVELDKGDPCKVEAESLKSSILLEIYFEG